MPETPEAVVRLTCYEVSCLPEGDINAHIFAITVEYRGAGQWAVMHVGYALSTGGEWDYEPRPSSRDDDWLVEHRFGLDTALELAKAEAPKVVVNGHTVAEVLARRGGA